MTSTNNVIGAIDQYKLGRSKNPKKNSTKKPSLRPFRLTTQTILKLNKGPRPPSNLGRRRRKNTARETENKTRNSNHKKAPLWPTKLTHLKLMKFLRQKKIIKTV